MDQSIRKLVSQRLKKAMREHPNINTQLALQKKSGVAQATIGRILREEVNAGIETLSDLARALDIDTTYFIAVEVGGAQPLQICEASARYGNAALSVPIISWESATSWGTPDYRGAPIDESAVTVGTFSQNSFALRASRESITGASGISVPEGALIYVDADVKPANANIVAVAFRGNPSVVIKRYIVDGPNQYLQAASPSYGPIRVSDECRIVGVVKKIEINL